MSWILHYEPFALTELSPSNRASLPIANSTLGAKFPLPLLFVMLAPLAAFVLALIFFLS